MLVVERDVGKCSLRYAEILRQNLAGHVGEQVRDQKGLVFRKAAAVENQKEFATFLETLDRMRNGGGKIPQIAHADIVDKGASLFVDGGDAGAAGEHVGPFRFLVPMHLANRAGLEAHVDA